MKKLKVWKRARLIEAKTVKTTRAYATIHRIRGRWKDEAVEQQVDRWKATESREIVWKWTMEASVCMEMQASCSFQDAE